MLGQLRKVLMRKQTLHSGFPFGNAHVRASGSKLSMSYMLLLSLSADVGQSIPVRYVAEHPVGWLLTFLNFAKKVRKVRCQENLCRLTGFAILKCPTSSLRHSLITDNDKSTLFKSGAPLSTTSKSYSICTCTSCTITTTTTVTCVDSK